MRWVIGAVAALVVGGLIWAAWVTSPTGSPNTAPTSPDATAPAPALGASPGATPVPGSEVIAPTPDQSPLTRLPPVSQPTPLVTAPLPPNGTRQGGLVDGFPTQIVGESADSEVIDSSVTSEGATMQASLRSRTDRTPAEVLDRFRDVWSALGLSPAAAADGTLTFSDLHSTLTVSVAETGTGTLYTLYATLRTE